eukprot:gnl/TRDRNA2_/TRDRNA2_47723_c0_seq1.p1 gnl/TRDRNA2_/TRDRNA2_47723_c0~~gnl/TRDRNA2_/TRDRNA2_47723_c0_seq1.p1  ORF type:complete len:244 (-),score=35.71 gnl/TRDRNA2_/TRDRNA2_47723_c0_seq1:130-861(-)
MPAHRPRVNRSAHDPSSKGFPARIDGQTLAFCGPHYGSWMRAEGNKDPLGTATMVPKDDGRVFGTVCFMTKEQIDKLDVFEGYPVVYTRNPFDAEAFLGDVWQKLQVIAYVKVDSLEWHAPSEPYCCAILRNVHGSFPEIDELILRDTECKVRGTWKHPGFARLSLSALLFEVGARACPPWILPGDVATKREALERVGVKSSGELASMIRSSNVAELLDGGGLHQSEVEIVQRLLQSEGYSLD